MITNNDIEQLRALLKPIIATNQSDNAESMRLTLHQLQNPANFEHETEREVYFCIACCNASSLAQDCGRGHDSVRLLTDAIARLERIIQSNDLSSLEFSIEMNGRTADADAIFAFLCQCKMHRLVVLGSTGIDPARAENEYVQMIAWIKAWQQSSGKHKLGENLLKWLDNNHWAIKPAQKR